ncbi:Flp pilus assembly protein CpaB [Thalassotalea fonticola]|uniref:Flp pilus assembly protein CpaB n=1 Tax=Thalassotalea fonticola TaxID=3065649 RepID=A0ABZ0GTU7_9GAMM|nr:Flp pilus assembly protein CpaB [Colwelliaceae bacterium S1-1]
MNKNTVVFIALSVGFGGGAVMLAKSWLDDHQPKDLQAGQSHVVTVNSELNTGSILDAKHLTLVSMPEAMVPEGALTTIDSATGMVVKQKLYSGDIIRAERVAKKGEGSALASLIGQNMRAVSIRVNDVVGVSGFLLPGNRVDVLTTYRKNKNSLTEVVLTNIKILAIDQRASNDENKPQLVRAVTLEVNLEQAEVLMSAQSKGSLQLALRNPNDFSEVDISELAQQSAEPEVSTEVAVLPEIPKIVSASRNKVEIIRGVEKEIVQITN